MKNQNQKQTPPQQYKGFCFAGEQRKLLNKCFIEAFKLGQELKKEEHDNEKIIKVTELAHQAIVASQGLKQP